MSTMPAVPISWLGAASLILIATASFAQSQVPSVQPRSPGAPSISGAPPIDGSMHAQYRECAAARPQEVRLATLANELVNNRQTLALVEKMHQEKQRNAQADPGRQLSGEWRMLARIDPAQGRAELAQQFAAYRAMGGPATRVEDVQPIPNPCLPQRAVRSEAAGPSPVRREALMIPAKK